MDNSNQSSRNETGSIQRQLSNRQEDVQHQEQMQEELEDDSADENHGYFLPDFLENEISENTTTQKQIKQITSTNTNQVIERLPIPNKNDSFNMNSDRSHGVFSELNISSSPFHGGGGSSDRNQTEQIQSLCNICSQPILINHKYIKVQDNTFVHIQCYNLSQQSAAQPQYSPILSVSPFDIDLSPDMLSFDFQILHPTTMISIFSLENIKADFQLNQQSQSLIFKKLLCNSTSLPLSVGLVSFKWRFFQDNLNSALNYSNTGIDNMNILNSINQVTQIYRANFIQEPLNFTQLFALNNSEVNIGIRKKILDQFNQIIKNQQPSNTLINLDFNYTFYQDIIPNYQMQHPMGMQSYFTVHILRNLKLSFQLPFEEYELLKKQTLQILQQNPLMIQYLNNGLAQKSPKKIKISSKSVINRQSSQHVENDLEKLQISHLSQKDSKIGSGKSSESTSNYDHFVEEDKFDENNVNSSYPRSSRNLMYNPKNAQRKSERPNLGIQVMALANPFEDEVEMRRIMTQNVQEKKPGNQVFRDYFKRYTAGGKSFEASGGSNENSHGTNGTIGDFSSNSSSYLARQDTEEPSNQLLIPRPSKTTKKRKGTHSSSGSKKSRNSAVSQAGSSGSTGKGSSTGKKGNDPSEDTLTLMNELRGNVANMARQQYGSKQLQRYLEKAAPELVGFVIEEVVRDLHELMSDQYGNYFCQKLMTSSSSSQRLMILKQLRPDFLKISCDKKGTHSMQCLIDMISMPEEEQEIEDGLRDNVIPMCFDQNANHVIQKVMICFKEDRIGFIYNQVMARFVDLALDQNGLCVIKKLINKIQSPQRIAAIGQILTDNAVKLVQNPYGNYAVQEALDKWEVRPCEGIFYKLEDHLMQLSVQKFSSNVIEKILEKAQYVTVERYMKRLCTIEVMKSLIKNIYGYYVIHKLISIMRDKHSGQADVAYQVINDTIQYATDKSLNSKWLSILEKNY